MMAVSDTFAALLDPLDVNEFLARYWGKDRLLISRNDANRYSHLLTEKDIDDLVYFGRWCFAAPDSVGSDENATVVRGKPSEIAGAGYRHLELHELRALYQQGKTIVLNALQRRLPSVAALGRGVEQALQCPVSVVMYLTPPGARGLPPHFDDSDLFICQLEGTKLWRFYESGRELPLDLEIGDLDDDLTAAPIGECRLRPGDLLYLPRGVGHGAIADDQRSLHLTLGAQVFRWADLLGHAVACMSRNEVMLREALPIGWARDDEIRTSMRDQFGQLLRLVADRASLDDGLGDLGIRFVDALGELPAGTVAEPLELGGLDVETLMEKQPGDICVVTREGDLATIHFPGGTLRGPSLIADALHFVASTDRPFHVFDLPGAMSAQSKKVLVRRLAKEGLLRRVDVPAVSASENG